MHVRERGAHKTAETRVDEFQELPFLKNIGLFVTYKCQVACPHCVVEAGPHRAEAMSVEDALDWIGQVAAYRNGYIRVLSLTGGEPFYDLPNLKQIASFADAHGLLVSAVTNAFWAPTQEAAVGVLRDLPAIKMLSVSTDVYHQRHIPLQRVKNAIIAARQCDLPCTAAVCTEDEEDTRYQSIVQALLEITDARTILTAVTFRAGRALSSLDGHNYPMSAQPPPSACAAGGSPIIFPDGRVTACIGPVIELASSHPLVLGNLRTSSLHEILDRAESNAIVHAIRVWGPRKLIAWLRQSGLGDHLPDLYIKDSVCNACYSLMSNERVVESLGRLSADYEFRRRVAYARVYYLRETRMAELLDVEG